MANKYMKKFPTFLAIRKYKSKLQSDPSHPSENGYHLKKLNNWQGCGEKGTLSHCWWECKLVLPLWKMI
jgi:hypothetical protein